MDESVETTERIKLLKRLRKHLIKKYKVIINDEKSSITAEDFSNLRKDINIISQEIKILEETYKVDQSSSFDVVKDVKTSTVPNHSNPSFVVYNVTSPVRSPQKQTTSNIPTSPQKTNDCLITKTSSGEKKQKSNKIIKQTVKTSVNQLPATLETQSPVTINGSNLSNQKFNLVGHQSPIPTIPQPQNFSPEMLELKENFINWLTIRSKQSQTPPKPIEMPSPEPQHAISGIPSKKNKLPKSLMIPKASHLGSPNFEENKENLENRRPTSVQSKAPRKTTPLANRSRMISAYGVSVSNSWKPIV